MTPRMLEIENGHLRRPPRESQFVLTPLPPLPLSISQFKVSQRGAIALMIMSSVPPLAFFPGLSGLAGYCKQEGVEQSKSNTNVFMHFKELLREAKFERFYCTGLGSGVQFWQPRTGSLNPFKVCWHRHHHLHRKDRRKTEGRRRRERERDGRRDGLTRRSPSARGAGMML